MKARQTTRRRRAARFRLWKSWNWPVTTTAEGSPEERRMGKIELRGARRFRRARQPRPGRAHADRARGWSRSCVTTDCRWPSIPITVPPSGTGVPNQWTKLRVWLLKLAIDLIHATPSTRRAAARTNASIAASRQRSRLAALTSHAQAQKAFDRWRNIYNHHRPHQGIDMALPASRYRPSLRPLPNRLPEPADDPHHAEPRSRPHRGVPFCAVPLIRATPLTEAELKGRISMRNGRDGGKSVLASRGLGL